MGLEKTTLEQRDFMLIMAVSEDEDSDSVINGFISDCGDLKPVHIPHHQHGAS